MISHFPKDRAVPSLDLIFYGITSPSNTDADPTQQTLLQRLEKKVFLAHMAGINVGNVEKYNTHFDCFDFFLCKNCLCVEKC